MYERVEKSKENSFPTKRKESRAVANSVTQKKSNGKQGLSFKDNRRNVNVIQRTELPGLSEDVYVPPEVVEEVMLPNLEMHELIQIRLTNRMMHRRVDRHVRGLLNSATNIYDYLRLLEQLQDQDIGHLYYNEVMNGIQPLLVGLDHNLLTDFYNSLPNSTLYNDLRNEINNEVFRDFDWFNEDFDDD